MSERQTHLEVRVERGGFRLEVDAGWDERVAVIFGPSGAGKSTLFEVVLGLAGDARARVRLGGATLEDNERGQPLNVVLLEKPGHLVRPHSCADEEPFRRPRWWKRGNLARIVAVGR